jgi:hypothetical protein
MTMIPSGPAPSSTGIGAPGTAPAPANLSRSPMSNTPSAQQSAVPFTRGSSLATMKDATLSLAAGASQQVGLQTNAFLENIILDVQLVTAGNAATVAFAADSPWQVINQIKLDDPAGQSIVAPITGYHLYLLNKYLTDTDCRFDPKGDTNYYATTGAVGTGGSFGFRLVMPVEHRKRDALGALNNSAANQRYLLTVYIIASFATLYTTAPTTGATVVNIQLYQQYWTSPPSVITTSQGSAQVQATPSGLGSVAFVRYERHNEVSGGGTPQIQLNNVGDYITGIGFVLRDTAGARDVYAVPQSATNANFPNEFDWWVNDFQVHALSAYGPGGNTALAGNGAGGVWPRMMSRFYGYPNAYETANGLDNGVYFLVPLVALFDRADNFAPANQYLPTDATTKLQIRGSTWGTGASFLEVLTRLVRPVSGSALFS